jgi:expansin (peptidoglycan-binding protein)
MVAIKSIPLLSLIAAALATPIQKRNYHGQVTYYHPEVDIGSCGKFHDGNDMIVAINAPQMGNGPNPNTNSKCFRTIRAYGPKGHVDVKVVDTCASCSHGDIDLSPAAFAKIADMNDGRLPVEWHWL